MTTIKVEITQNYTPLAEIDKALIKQLKSEKMLAYELEVRLQEWGWWYSKCLDNGMGYPNRSITVAALEGSPGTAPIYPQDNPRAEEVHLAYLKLKQLHLLWAGVLRVEYVRSKIDLELEKNLTRSKKMEDRAKKLNLTYGNYRQYLRSAKSFIEGRISR